MPYNIIIDNEEVLHMLEHFILDCYVESKKYSKYECLTMTRRVSKLEFIENKIKQNETKYLIGFGNHFALLLENDGEELWQLAQSRLTAAPSEPITELLRILNSD